MTLWVVLVTAAWLAGTISGVLGFGGALLFLPVLTYAVGTKEAVPILTVAQLLGNLSRAGLGWREIQWRPALVFSAGAVPASLLGSRIFVALPPGLTSKVIGVFLLAFVAWRRTAIGRRSFPSRYLMAAGVVVGLISSIAGSAGPLGAAAFLGLRLPHRAYVASEAVSAVLIHLTKSFVYERHAALTLAEVAHGLGLGAAMMLGSWAGRRLIDQIPGSSLETLVDVLLALAAISMIFETL